MTVQETSRGDPVIAVTDLVTHYGSRRILDGVSTTARVGFSTA
jgi:ABC-type histidine transport system ATPase subunit